MKTFLTFLAIGVGSALAGFGLHYGISRYKGKSHAELVTLYKGLPMDLKDEFMKEMRAAYEWAQKFPKGSKERVEAEEQMKRAQAAVDAAEASLKNAEAKA